MRRFGLALSMILGAAEPAHAQTAHPPHIALLPRLSGQAEGAPGAAELRALLLADLRLRPELLPVPEESLHGDGEESLEAAVSACGADAGCIGARLERAGIELGLVLAVDLGASPPLASGLLVDGRSRRALGLQVEELSSAAQVGPQVRALAAGLLDRAGYPLGARLVVRLHPADAELWVDDRPGPEISTTLSLGAGPHRLRARREGWAEAQRQLRLSAGESTEVELALQPLPEPSVLSSPWLWLGVGAAVLAATGAALAAGGAFSTKVGCACVAEPGASCRCP